MNLNENLVQSIKNKFINALSEEMGVGVAGEGGSSFSQRQQQAFQQRQAERRAANAAKRTPQALAAKKAEREAKIAETRAREPKHTVIQTPKKPEIRTVEPGYKGPSINPDGSFNITAEQQRVAAENRAGMQAARQGSRESATTQYGRLVQRMGPGALRPARSQYEAEQQAAARADLDKAYAEAGDRPIGYEDQERLYAGFARRGYRPGQPMSEYEVTQPANAAYNAALENKKRVEAEVAKNRAERMSRPQTALFRDPTTGETKSMTSAELDAAYERTKR